MRRLSAVLLVLLACRDERAAIPDAAAESAAPPEIRVSADRADLVYSYLDPETGAYRTAARVDEVPEAARRQVIVTDLSLSPEERRSDRYVYIADLGKPRPDGSYPVAVASRYAFEAKLTETSTAPSARREVIVYSAAWCGVCKKTKRILEQLGVPYVEKDIEASRKAAEELAAKAQAAGIRPGGVPVIDVAGTLLQGLDEPTLRATLEQKGLL